MSDFNPKTFKELLKEFYKIKKRILQNRPLTTNEFKINEYVKLLIETYNAVLTYTSLYDGTFSSETKLNIYKSLIHSRELLVRCFGKLDCKVRVPHDVLLFELVDGNIEVESDSESIHKLETIDNSDSYSSDEGNNKLGQPTVSSLGGIGNEGEDLNMATVERKKSFISMCSNIIRDNYDGNPLTLDSFLDKIHLIESLTEEDLKPTLVFFIKSKLEAKAREALPENVESVSEIKQALKSRIKPDSSKVIAGRIVALNVKNNNYVEFSKQAEELADAFERSLVIEGITRNKAHEMAIAETVSMCRLNAKTDLVKSILASSSFADPKEVIAKLVVEQATERKEQQILTFRANPRNSVSYQNSNNFNRYRRNNFHRGSNRGNHRNDYFQQGNNNNRNFNNPPDNNFQNNYRGNRRGQHSRGFHNNRASVRVLNEESPQQTQLLGEENLN